jgi:23S rRNA (adenine2030-N6)-methyltransferase
VNYRHAYHAGNFGDVVKHAVLALLIERLKEKPAAFAVLDTHAGIGQYDLQSEAAQKTGEATLGIGRLLEGEPQPLLKPYLDVVRASADYPGSPRLARALLRPQDRLILCELHPEDFAALRRNFRNDTQVALHHRDAWEALPALVPPQEKRGLVLVDPAFEALDEFARMLKALGAAHRRWPTGQYALWYPIKHRAPVDMFLGALKATGLKKLLLLELTVHGALSAERLNGCDMVLVNPPWRFDAAMLELLPWLQARLAQSGGDARVEWLSGE